jgi:hypothetical protein
MALQITGKVLKVGFVEDIPTKKGDVFRKRELVLDATRYDSYTGERGFDNFPAFEFTQEKVKELDGLREGEVVTVSFDLQGNKFTTQEGQEKYFTRVRGYKVDRRQASQPAVAQPTEPFPPVQRNDDLPF